MFSKNFCSQRVVPFLFAASMTSLSACNESEKVSAPQPVSSNPTVKPDVSRETQNSVASETELSGEWEGPCDNENDGIAVSSTGKLSFAKNTFVLSSKEYAQTGCSGNPVLESHIRGTFKLEGKKIDVIPVKFFMRPLDKESLSIFSLMFNGEKCGDVTWKIGKETDVSQCPQVKKDFLTAIYTTYKIDDGKLFLAQADEGDESGESPQKRSTRFDEQVWLKKK